MNEVEAALIAVAVIYVINRRGLVSFGWAEVLWIGPIVEEVGKTSSAWIFGAMIWPVHFLFGVIEGVFDISTGAPRKYGAALASIAGHSVYGGVTAWGVDYFASWWLGILLGTGMHVLWNSFVVIVLAKRPRK